MSIGIIYFGEDLEGFADVLKVIETDCACVTSRMDTGIIISVVFSSKLDNFEEKVLSLLESKKIGPNNYIWTHSDAEHEAFLTGFKIGFTMQIK